VKRSLILLLALGACVSPPKHAAAPVVAPPPVAVPVLPPQPPVAWEDRARTPGDWALTGGVARFEPVDGAAVLTLRCAGPEIVLAYPAAQAGALTIRTTTLARTLQIAAGGEARLAASDPLLDAMIYSRGRFMVSAAGEPDLIIPPWPEVARVVEDCRR
jgi:hypothetical protein